MLVTNRGKPLWRQLCLHDWQSVLIRKILSWVQLLLEAVLMKSWHPCMSMQAVDQPGISTAYNRAQVHLSHAKHISPVLRM